MNIRGLGKPSINPLVSACPMSEAIQLSKISFSKLLECASCADIACSMYIACHMSELNPDRAPLKEVLRY